MSDDLGFDFACAVPWFPHDKEKPYVLVRVSDEHAKSWADALGLTVRRCYVSDSIVTEKAKEHGVDNTESIAARMPDAGGTMAGDQGWFGPGDAVRASAGRARARQARAPHQEPRQLAEARQAAQLLAVRGGSGVPRTLCMMSLAQVPERGGA